MAMGVRIESVPGMSDIMPEEAALWQWVETRCRDVLRRYGFGEIRTPIVERTELFLRTTGEGSEVVQKQMFTFADRSGRSLALRPEGTPSVMRALLEHQADAAISRVFYVGPMFRSERPQAGRRRQFHQLGAEAIGTESAAADAEMIALTYDLCAAVGLEDARVVVNSIGTAADQGAIRTLLAGHFAAAAERLCAECRRRLEGNVLRILDCKNAGCQTAIEAAPALESAIAPESREHFARVLALLAAAGVPYQCENRLVRGLDYYSRTVWEVRHPALGAQDALGGGGRYDRLAASLGDRADRPGVGFAMGLERMLLAIQAAAPAPAGAAPPLVWVVSAGEAAVPANFCLLHRLRREGLAAAGEFERPSLRAQMRLANRAGAPWVMIRGDAELAQGLVCLKEMAGGRQWLLAEDEAIEQVKKGVAAGDSPPPATGSGR